MNPETTSTTSAVDPAPVYPEPPLRRVAPAKTARHTAVAQDEPSRCQHHFANGKRCRLPGIASQFGFCLRHFTLNAAVGASRLQQPNDFEDLSADLLPELSEFGAALPVNQFLSRLLVLVTRGRVTPRRAAVMAYITNQLLHSHRAIEREQALEEEGPAQFDFTGWPGLEERQRERAQQGETIRVDLGDLPRPDRSQPYTGVVHPIPADVSVPGRDRDNPQKGPA